MMPFQNCCHSYLVFIRDPDTQRATFKLNDISEVSEQEPQGCLRAKFDLASGGPVKPKTTMLVFGSEGANLSGVDFELVGSGYRLSLTKKRFCTGWLFDTAFLRLFVFVISLKKKFFF